MSVYPLSLLAFSFALPGISLTVVFDLSVVLHLPKTTLTSAILVCALSLPTLSLASLEAFYGRLPSSV